jgi:hypothetical protein
MRAIYCYPGLFATVDVQFSAMEALTQALNTLELSWFRHKFAGTHNQRALPGKR